MWISGQQELINGDLTPRKNAIIVNCKDVCVPEILEKFKREAAITVLNPINIGWARGRWAVSYTHLTLPTILRV